ncbi:potassium-transporting ATPase subunit C [Dubosiella newyorkensis]|uniref:Potassium-transporting ATPase subunit C n=1 Tax=Dubosiella newyorkensis TaxID=1862672 RepID=A0A1U7NNW5_9FIRM|nr:potassium-transporting ATPase subunit C [Dubosiella newyorkensis]OLU47010.1 hypothetical protein BO225_03675 [Dubosiella newyorkensis]
MKTYIKAFIPSLKVLIASTLVLGFLYSFSLWGISQLFFPDKAAGSFVATQNGKTSLLAGENYKDPSHLWGRRQKKQAIQQTDGSWTLIGVPANNDPADPEYLKEKEAWTKYIELSNPDASKEIPQELVTFSASGYDPDLSLSAALWQAPRIAKASRLSEEKVKQIIENNINPSLLEEKTVNVIEVNLALDQQKAALQ